MTYRRRTFGSCGSFSRLFPVLFSIFAVFGATGLAGAWAQGTQNKPEKKEIILKH